MAQTQTAIELIATSPRGQQKQDAPQPEVQPNPNHALRKGPTTIIFTSITAVNTISSMLAGLVTVALPRMVDDLDIPPSLTLW
jgi:hypothetical protein